MRSTKPREPGAIGFVKILFSTVRARSCMLSHVCCDEGVPQKTSHRALCTSHFAVP
jgi:hypothetical protein